MLPPFEPSNPPADLRMSSLPLHNKEKRAMIPNSRSRRGLLAYLALFLTISWTTYTVCARYHAPTATSQVAKPILEEAAGKGIQQYGLSEKPQFQDMIQLLDLPTSYLPEIGKHRHPGRLIVVGDVHGMKDALIDLLDKVRFDHKHDHLILAGDMISKGPDSAGVVDLAMKLGATGIRGNHEDRIILAYHDMMAKHAELDAPGPSENKDRAQDALEEESFSHGDYKDRQLVKELGKHRIKWLEKCPVILRVGKLAGIGKLVVVHGGLAPGVKLEKQDPTLVMNMRTIGKDGVPSDESEGKGWMKKWNKHQKSLRKKDRTTVIYGHDSKRGLQIKKYSMGIDTGCRKGGKLTAVVIEGGHSNHSHRVVHVNCKR